MACGVVLVTGGASFIGDHTVRLLLERGYDVIILDNLYTCSRDNVPEGAELIVGDVADRDIVARVVKRVDYVVHLATIVSVDEARENPFEATRLTYRGHLMSWRNRIGKVLVDSFMLLALLSMANKKNYP